MARLNGPAGLARADAGVIVTEYGVADLRGLSLARRRERMIAIAHPAHRAAAAGGWRLNGGPDHDHDSTTTRRAAIVAPVRTPVGTFGGSLRAVPVEDLAATAIKAVVERSGIDPELIEDVVFAQSYANSEAPCIGRWAALHAGLPVSVPGLQIDRRCGGGLQAVITAAMTVQTGAADVVLAGGVESMSNIEHYTTTARWGARAGNQMLYDRLDRGREMSQPEWRFGAISGMIETAENLAARVRHRPGRGRRLRRPQPPARRGRLGRGPVRRRDRPGPGAAAARRPGDWSAGTRASGPTPPPRRWPSCARSCRAAPSPRATPASRTTPPRRAWWWPRTGSDELGLEPIGYLEGWAAVGCEPARMGIGPVGAVEKLFRRTGWGSTTST